MKTIGMAQDAHGIGRQPCEDGHVGFGGGDRLAAPDEQAIGLDLTPAHLLTTPSPESNQPTQKGGSRGNHGQEQREKDGENKDASEALGLRSALSPYSAEGSCGARTASARQPQPPASSITAFSSRSSATPYGDRFSSAARRPLLPCGLPPFTLMTLQRARRAGLPANFTGYEGDWDGGTVLRTRP